MATLFTPMLYTSLTTAVGFISLALTPIPPVQVFGIYIAIGVMVAWLLTVTFIPASVMFIRESSLANFGLTEHNADEESHSLMTRLLRATGRGTFRFAKPILAVAVGLVIVAIAGISRVVINDNPVRWFEPKHEIRIADKVMNSHFGGTYMGYLALTAGDPLPEPPHLTAALDAPLREQADAWAKADVAAAEAFARSAPAGRTRRTATTRDGLLRAARGLCAERVARRRTTATRLEATGLSSRPVAGGPGVQGSAVLNWMSPQEHC